MPLGVAEEFRNKRYRVFEAFLIGFIILIFSLSATQSSYLLYQEFSAYPEKGYSDNTQLMVLRAAANDFEGVLIAYSSDDSFVEKKEVVASLDYLRSYLQKVVQSYEVAGVVDGDAEKLVGEIDAALVYLRGFIAEKDAPLSSGDRASVQKKISILDQLFADFSFSVRQAHLLKISQKEQADHVYLFLSITSMVVSGLGLIILLLLKIKYQEKMSDDRQRMLQILESRLAAMEASMDGIVIIDSAGHIKYANKALASYHGYQAPADFLDKSWRILLSEDSALFIERNVMELLTKNWRWRGRCHGLRADGSTYPQDVSITLTVDGGQIWIVRDSSETLKNMELSEQRLAAIEAAGDGIGIVDRDGNLTYINRALMDLHGLESADLKDYIGKPWENLYTPKGQAQVHNEVMPLLKERSYWKGDTPLARKDGTVIYAEMSLTRLPDGGLIGTARDITERKKSEAEKEVLQEQFFQAQKMEAIGRLSGGIAHDFNNILASMIGYTEFLLEDLEPKSETHKFAWKIMQGGIQAKKLVEQILSFSRRNETARSMVDVVASLSETLTMLWATLPVSVTVQKNIEIESGIIRGNATQVGQTLMNLCVNAIDAMEDERGELDVTVGRCMGGDKGSASMHVDTIADAAKLFEVNITDLGEGELVAELGRLARDQSYVFVSVSDTGSGMSREVMDHIFEPFFTTKSVDKGTGLGLSTVHSIVGGHGGAVIVRSVIGKGTTFTLFFPEAEAQPVAGVAEVEAAIETGRGTILIVDDQESVRDMLSNMVRRLGYDVDVCDSGGIAIDLLREDFQRYDLVLSDQSMPEMTGSEMAAQLYEDFPDLPVILLTGYSGQKAQDLLGRSPSIIAVLSKPIGSAALSHEIKMALARKKKAA